MTDNYNTYKPGLTSPANKAFTITPNDVSELEEVTRALYVGSSGDISLIMKSGQTIIFSGVSAGSILPIRVSHINSTNTTASNIIGLV